MVWKMTWASCSFKRVPFQGKFLQFSGGLNHPCQLYRHNSRDLRGSDGGRDLHLRRKQGGNGPPWKRKLRCWKTIIFWSFTFFVSFRGVEHMEFGSEMVSNGNPTIFRFHVFLQHMSCPVLPPKPATQKELPKIGAQKFLKKFQPYPNASSSLVVL